MTRILLDYALGALLVLFGSVALTSGTGPLGVAFGVVLLAVGVLILLARIVAGREKV